MSATVTTLSASTTSDAAKSAFEFGTMVFDTVPRDPPRFGYEPLPFKERFTALAAEIEKDGKARGFCVPARFFVEERKADPEKVTHAYIKQKLGDEWGKWLKEDNRRSQKFDLVKTRRTGEESDVVGMGLGVIAILRPIPQD